MQSDNQTVRGDIPENLVEAVIRIGILVVIIVMCARIFAPFAGVLLWALLLAVTLYPLHLRFADRLGGRQGVTASLIVIIGILLLGVPTVMLGNSFAGQVHGLYTAIESGSLALDPPDPSVAGWPLVGERVHATWSAAANDLPLFLEKYQPQIRDISRQVLSISAGTLSGLFLFFGALIISGIMMAYGESGGRSMRRIICRLAGNDRGDKLLALSTATVRSVAMGVIGVAFIQALLLGAGFIMAGVPGAGLLALVVMLIGIMQLPAVLVSIPVVIYLWTGDASATSNIIYTIYLLLAGVSDNVLKPFLLGRGVDAPMPVILIGALGGMIWQGFIGLFVGAVTLAVGYRIFMEWVDSGYTGKSLDPEAATE
jgi:predicted PurR-regulated permease PerM